MTSNDDLSRFIVSSFPSVWTLEILLLLKRDQRQWTRAELIDTLRASDLVVDQSLESLVAAGLASVGEETAEYLPTSEGVADCVDKAEELYARKPDKVRRMIVTSAASGITAFADAFKLRKD